MNNLETLRKRINALFNNTIDDRTKNLRKLTDEQRERYARWLERCKAHAATFKESGDYYAAMLVDDYVDRDPLGDDIAIALNGRPPVLTGDDKRDEALLVDHYRKACER